MVSTSTRPLNLIIRIGVILCFAVLLSWPVNSASARTFHSYAFVNDDGSLRIKGRTIHLDGIHIPHTEETCKFFINPPLCGSRAAVALRFKINGFVHCETTAANRDGSFTAHCRINKTAFDEGLDLSAYLLERGWALALPDAPFHYGALEKVARHNHLGLWGFSVDRILAPGRKK